MTREELKNRYINEKSLLEQYGHQSVITFEEWLEMQKKQWRNNNEQDSA